MVVVAPLSQQAIATAAFEHAVRDVGLEPSAAELLSAQEIDQEVGGGVDAEKEVGKVNNLVDEGGRLALLLVRIVAVDDLIDVGEEFERLADDEHEGDGDQEAAQLVLLALFLKMLHLLL